MTGGDKEEFSTLENFAVDHCEKIIQTGGVVKAGIDLFEKICGNLAIQLHLVQGAGQK